MFLGHYLAWICAGIMGAAAAKMLHAGLPVQRGEKWIATKWLREKPYRRS